MLINASIQAQNNSYFQQEVRYNIAVSLNTENHTLQAQERFVYINHSPNELTFLYLHLWPNAYKNNKTALAKQFEKDGNLSFYWSDSISKGFIDEFKFKVNGEPALFELDQVHIDYGKLILNKPLKSGDSLIVETPFRVKIPDSRFSRLGQGNNTYQITQWYIKPAVYDNKGWHPMPYLNQGEFYSEFGSFDVQITVPRDYVVAASGLIEKFVRFDDTTLTQKTYRAKINNVHDFAWFAGNNYKIEYDTLNIAGSEKPIYVQAYYDSSKSKHWHKAVSFGKNAVKSYSSWVGNYPYDVCTIVDGNISAGAGMEYPTITVLTDNGSEKSFDQVIAHEIGHNWFYGILASNERDYGWMDEGLNSYFENRYMRKYYPDGKLIGEKSFLIYDWLGLSNLLNSHQSLLFYNILQSNNYDQALNTHSKDFTGLNYGAIMYSKTALILKYLESVIGTKRFDLAMHNYYQEWKFKHPYPEDLKLSFEKSLNQNLDWFFNDLIDTRKGIDYKIKSHRKSKNGFDLTIKNNSSIASPFLLGKWKDNQIITDTIAGFSSSKTITLNEKFDQIIIDPYLEMSDINRKNNELRTQGIFKKVAPIKLGLLTGPKFFAQNSIYFLPVFGYNQYNGGMPGLAFHNLSPKRSKFEWLVAGMYGLKNESIAYKAHAVYHIKPNTESFNNLNIGFSSKSFAISNSATLFQILPFVEYEIKHGGLASKKTSIIEAKMFYNNIEKNGNNRDFETFQLNYQYEKRNKLKPFVAKLTNEFTHQYAKSWLEMNTSRYYIRKKQIHFRAFAGAFLNKNGNVNEFDYDARFRLSSFRGFQDYRFENNFIGRNEFSGFWSRQIAQADGGFVNSGFLGQSWDYLAAANIKFELPLPLPINIFANVAHYKNEEPDRVNFIYEAGASITVLKGICEVYFPFVYSSAIDGALKLQGFDNFGSRIRFTLALEKLAPEQLIKKLKTID